MLNYTLDQQSRKTAAVRTLLVTALMLGCAFATATNAAAQSITVPPTPTSITPPVGSNAFLVGHAVGTQGYICLPTSAGASTAAWNSNNARPEATLFTTFFGREIQIITHFLSRDAKPNDNAPSPLPFGSATWQSSFDSSKLWAQKVGAINAGEGEPSCPNANSIACLLLQSIGNQEGPTGGKALAHTTYVQRLNTKGGLAPADGCATANDVGKQALVPYTADYYFYHGTQQ